MRTVALHARGSRPVTSLESYAVEALGVTLLLGAVAVAAIDRCEFLFVRKFLNARKIGVAVAAF